MENTKLIEVNRFIEVENLELDRTLHSIDINHIPLEDLLLIFEPHERGDPFLYDPYDINESQLTKLNEYLATPLFYDERVDYTLAAFGVYLDTITGKIIK